MIKRISLSLAFCVVSCTTPEPKPQTTPSSEPQSGSKLNSPSTSGIPIKENQSVGFILRHYQEQFSPTVEVRMRGKRTAEDLASYLKRPDNFQRLVNLFGDLMFTLDMIEQNVHKDQMIETADHLLSEFASLLGEESFSKDNFATLKRLRAQLAKQAVSAQEVKLFLTKVAYLDLHRLLREKYNQFLREFGFWYHTLLENSGHDIRSQMKSNRKGQDRADVGGPLFGPKHIENLHELRLNEILKTYDQQPEEKRGRFDVYLTTHILPLYLPQLNHRKYLEHEDSVELHHNQMKFTVFNPVIEQQRAQLTLSDRPNLQLPQTFTLVMFERSR